MEKKTRQGISRPHLVQRRKAGGWRVWEKIFSGESCANPNYYYIFALN